MDLGNTVVWSARSLSYVAGPWFGHGVQGTAGKEVTEWYGIHYSGESYLKASKYIKLTRGRNNMISNILSRYRDVRHTFHQV